MITLEITFRGLFLFVPDEERRCVHVLVPAPRGGSLPGEPEAHPSPSGARVLIPGDDAFELSLDGWALALGEERDTADTHLPGGVPDLAALLEHRLDPRLTGDDPGPLVASRITLHAGGITRLDGRPLRSRAGTDDAPAREVTWTIRLPHEPLAWSRTRLNTGAPPARQLLPPLAPAEDGTVRMVIDAGPGGSGADVLRERELDSELLAEQGRSERVGLWDRLRRTVSGFVPSEIVLEPSGPVTETVRESGAARGPGAEGPPKPGPADPHGGAPAAEPTDAVPESAPPQSGPTDAMPEPDLPRSEPPAEEAPRGDEAVYLSGAAPRRVRPGDYFTAELAAYVKAYERQVAETMGRDYRPDEIQPGTPAAGPWPSGAKVTVRVHAPGLAVEESEQSFTWQGTYCHLEFDVGVPEDAPERRTVIRFEAYIDAVRVGKVSLNLEVSRAAAPGEETVSASAEGARKAFVSYSHKDRAEVLKAVGLLSPVLRDSEFFVDLVSLRTGEKWEPALEAAIRDCNLFLLFWSSNAQKSEWVTREWTYALDHHGDDVLQVLLLERVDPATVPERLSKFQFDSHWLRLAEQAPPA